MRGRHVDVVFLRKLWYRRQYPDYNMDSIVHLKLPADDCEVATKTALPVLVAQHKYRFSPMLFVIQAECTAE